MNLEDARAIVENAYANGIADRAQVRAAVDATMQWLDEGSLRVAERAENGDWVVNAWAKEAILLSFSLYEASVFDRGHMGMNYDKMPLKTAGWGDDDFKRAGFRMVPPATVRKGAHIAPGAVLMPSYVNLGAYVGPGTMIDTWASVGSCAQVGANCHISAGTGIGGVLEPLQANPTIIEDDCFIGARSEVVEGVIVREGSVLAMGVFITQSTKIVYRDTGKVIFGEVPPYSVVVPGTLPGKDGAPGLACAVIVKTVDANTRAKTSINDLLR